MTSFFVILISRHIPGDRQILKEWPCTASSPRDTSQALGNLLIVWDVQSDPSPSQQCTETLFCISFISTHLWKSHSKEICWSGLSAMCKLYQRWKCANCIRGGGVKQSGLLVRVLHCPYTINPFLPLHCTGKSFQSALHCCFGLHLWRRQAV